MVCIMHFCNLRNIQSRPLAVRRENDVVHWLELREGWLKGAGYLQGCLSGVHTFRKGRNGGSQLAVPF
jgi:hypothetical protein